MSITYVHLSDIHFGQEKGADVVINNDAKERLIEDAAEQVKLHAGGSAKGLIVTGDIAFAGKPNEYADAAKWLDRLASAVGCPPTAVKLVPGNHDIDRDRLSSGCTFLIDEILSGGEARLDAFLANDDDCKTLYNRFVGYEPFALGYDCPLHPAGGIASDSREELAPGRFIRFFGLNSALICSKRKDEEGKLILGAAQRVLPSDPGVELVVLCHHPLHCLQDSVDARKYVRNRARVFISGHEHNPSLQIETIEDGCDLLMLASGATVPPKVENGYIYTYNLVTFDWCSKEDKLSVEVVPRAWNDDKKRFEADDVRLGGHKPRNLLASPNFRRGPPPAAERQPVPMAEPVPDALHPEPELSGKLPPDHVTTPEPASPQNAPMDAMSDTFQLVLLKFFRDLTAAQRLKVLIDLDALPDDWNEELTLMMERNLIEDLVKDGRLSDLDSSIERNRH
ncbi:metallophosphoesterase [Bradyrhizobium sp. SSUT77]|uniref:metallophosphoesterase n=1 Tax=Bradyrhizobium sp. SSUT77 TaxID=3040603 RepID=UPI00244A6E36|nr:metallophosphoesterase [Bradyrhizobium sp. SSUT77]MDH2348148.1 metallophosphoesterase [Bradyrhizobium sp. SSUT77]